jgi:hypothetical protein
VLDLAALDVAIGLVFLFFILSLICSAIQEFVAGLLNWRAKMLRVGVQNLLSGTPQITAEGRRLADTVYQHSLIQALIRPGRSRLPSYIPSRTFIAALLNVGAAAADPAKTVAELQKTIDAIDNAQVKRSLTALLQRAGDDIEKFQRTAEEWFDDAMERVSGWYRRKVQIALTIIAALLVAFLNADTIRLAQNLWTDQNVRKAVVASAGAELREPREAPEIRDVAQTVDELEELDIPLGWAGDDWAGVDWLLMKILGLVLTAAALTLGAPFWFDVLSKVARLRATGAPPPTTDAVRKGEGEEKRAGPTASAAPEEPHD